LLIVFVQFVLNIAFHLMVYPYLTDLLQSAHHRTAHFAAVMVHFVFMGFRTQSGGLRASSLCSTSQLICCGIKVD